jgi:hypothetical protein
VRRLRWEPGDQSVSKRPYRDSAILYGALAGLLVVLTAATGGPLLPGDSQGKGGLLGVLSNLGAVMLGVIVFVVATGFSWWRLRGRLASQKEHE